MAAARHPDPAHDASESLARLTHELANLLDGSLRNLALVLGHGPRDPATAPTDATEQRLRTVHAALRQMARLVQSAGRPDTAAHSGLEAGTVREAVEHAVGMIEPQAAADGTTLHVRVAGNAGTLPAGIAFTVLSNGLRNALEAVRTAGHGRGRIEVDARLHAASQTPARLVLRITDNGVGPPPPAPLQTGGFMPPVPPARACVPTFSTKGPGRGIGLALCRELVQERGGGIELTTGDAGAGACLTAWWPVAPVLPQGDTPARAGTARHTEGTSGHEDTEDGD